MGCWLRIILGERETGTERQRQTDERKARERQTLRQTDGYVFNEGL